MEEGRGPKVQESQGLWVQRSKGPEDQDISNSNSNTSLTLKKVHLVYILKILNILRHFLGCDSFSRRSLSTENVHH